MSAFNFVSNVHDVALKPRLLRGLLKDEVPDENQPFRSYSELSHVASLVETHGLISESFLESTDKKVIDDWTSAVDSWVERVLALASNDMPDKCWAGISLLGLTCKHCSSSRFLASYLVWFNRLLSYIQSAAASLFVKVASTASMSDLFIRLGRFPHGKKDGTLLAGKLIQPLLKLLTEDSSDAIWEGSVNLLCTILSVYPSSLHRHYDNVEISLASKILSGEFNVNSSKKLAYCLALLPRSKGDSDTWLLMMQKILLSLNFCLNNALQGLEEEGKGEEVVRLLVPPGKDLLPLLLGGPNLSDGASKDTRTDRLTVSSFSTLVLCCSIMLTNSYPVQVKVPVQPLLALVKRVLMVNGSVPHTSLPFTAAMQQELCSELPFLHEASLDLLIALLNGVRSQLLPYAGSLMRLTKELFRRCKLPELKKKVYSIAKILLISRGVGVAIDIGSEVVNNSSVDLKPLFHRSDDPFANSQFKVHSEAVTLQKKRKHSTIMDVEDQLKAGGLGYQAYGIDEVTSLMIAALEALEALLNVGGPLRSESWQSNVDHLLITIAKNSCELGLVPEEKGGNLPNALASDLADLQVAAFRALLASLLSSYHIRPPYLTQSLELFRKGQQEFGTKLAEFCTHALLSLEVLVHPRALPMMKCENCTALYGMDNSLDENKHSLGKKHSVHLSGGVEEMGLGISEDSDDNELYLSWLKNNDETVVQMAGTGENVKDSAVPSDTLRASQMQMLPVAGLPRTEILETIEQRQPSVTNSQADSRDEVMVEVQPLQEPPAQLQKLVTKEGTSGSTFEDSRNTASEMVASGAAALHSTMAFSVDATVVSSDRNAGVGGSTSSTLTFKKEEAHVSNLDYESSEDSFPDIVDVDPDSDE